MRFLGLSSATEVVSLGLIEDGRVMMATTLAEPRSEKIVFYLEASGVKPDQIDGVAVTTGPGSYSGLRGGLATAKTLAQTRSLPLVGVSTLAAMAYNLVAQTGTVLTILSARWDEYCLALFAAQGGALQRLTDDLVMTEAKLGEKLSQISGEIYVVGRSAKLRERLTQPNLHWAVDAQNQPSGVNVACLGWCQYLAGQTTDPLTLSPQYSHMPNIREYKG